MPNLTIGVAVILSLIGLFGYFGAKSDHPSMTALIPLFFGLALAVCGVMARRVAARKQAMHAAATIGLVGFVAAAWRGISKLSMAISDDPAIDNRPTRMVLLMALVCLIYVVLSIGSFIAARLRRARASERAS